MSEIWGGCSIKKIWGGCLFVSLVATAMGGVSCGGKALIEGNSDDPSAFTGGTLSTLGAGGAFSASGGRRQSASTGGFGLDLGSGGPPPDMNLPPIIRCGTIASEVAPLLAVTIWGDAGLTPEVQRMFVNANDPMFAQEVSYVVNQMLSDPRGQQGLRKFTLAWFGLPGNSLGGQGAGGVGGGSGVPEPSIHELMLEEGRRYVEWSLQDGEGRLDRLLTSPVALLNERLAAYYAVPRDPASASDAWDLVNLDSQERFGILTRGFWLSSNLNVARRGKAVMNDLLCSPIPPPPKEALPHGMVPPPQITYQELRQQVQAPACTDCHSLVDPPGIAFEHFTGDGRYRSTLGMQEVDTSGFFTHDFVANFGRGQTAFKFVGVNDYVGELAASEDVQICLVKKVAAYARLHAADAADATDFECLLRGYPGLAGASVAEAMRVLFSTLFIVGSASD